MPPSIRPSTRPSTRPSIRLHVAAPLQGGAMVEATAGQAHHLLAVMRRGVGDAVTLFNGHDGEWDARIATQRRDRATLAVTTCCRPQVDSPLRVLLWAPLKRDATDLVVQKATELGATAIQPVLTARGITDRVRRDRLEAIAIEAAEQCERLDVPVLRDPVTLQQALAGWTGPLPLWAAVERLERHHAPRGAAGGLLVGPEGGFAPEEVALIRRHPLVQTVSLGGTVLRAETAAIAGLALLHAAPPD